MLYSAASWPIVTDDWDKAAKICGRDPANAKHDEPRTYAVEAWLCVAEGLVKVSEAWQSEMDAHVRKALRKELGLPVKKRLVYRHVGCVSDVTDFRIRSVWRGCCVLELRLANGKAPVLPVNSMHFAAMN